MIKTLLLFFILIVICLLTYYLCKEDTHYRALCYIINNNPYFNQKVTKCEKNNEAYILDISKKRIQKLNKKLKKANFPKKNPAHS